MLNSSTKLMPKFAALSCIFVLILVNGSSLAPTGSFAPGEGATPLQSAVQAGELFLPVRSRRSSDHAAHTRVSVLLPHWSTAQLARDDPDGRADLQNFRSCALLFVKITKTKNKTKNLAVFKPSPFSQSMVWGRCFSFSFHYVYFHYFLCLSFSLFHSSLLSSHLGILPICNAHSSLLYQINSQYFLPSKGGVFSACRHAALFVSPQIGFLGVQNDLTFIYI